MLGRGMDGDLVRLARHGERDLALQIEMILAADPDPPGQALRRGRDRAERIAAHKGQRLGHQVAVRQRRINRQDGRQRLVLDFGQAGGAARLIPGQRRDREDRLAGIRDQAVRQQRLVMLVGRADVVDARQIGRG